VDVVRSNQVKRRYKLKKGKLFLLAGSMCLALIIMLLPFMAACAKEAPAPGPKIYHVQKRAATFGGSSYILSFAATDLLNKKSAWVRGAVVESTGSPENIKITGKDPKRRARTFFTCAAAMFDAARASEPPFDDTPELYKDVMVMMAEQRLGIGIMTLDPNIRNIADLKGKRVATWPKGMTKFVETYKFIEGAGKEVVDSIQWQHTMYQGYDDLLLGKVDAVYGLWAERGRGAYTAVPKVTELMSKADVYLVGATPEQRARIRELYGDIWGSSTVIPANEIAPGVPDKDKLVFMVTVGWMVYPEIPEDVVYEIVKTLHENYAMFKDYHPAGIGVAPENFGLVPAAKELWHPGARKYYEEKGLGYGTEYFFKAYPLD